MMRIVADEARMDALRRWLGGNDAALVEWLDGPWPPVRPRRRPKPSP